MEKLFFEAISTTPNIMRIRTWGTIKKCDGELKVETERNWPELRLDERNLIWQLAHTELDNPRVSRLHFLVEFERGELISEPKRFAIHRTEYYLISNPDDYLSLRSLYKFR